MRYILLILTLAGLTAATGCRMCAHPYDYCGPTYLGDCSDVVCNPLARAGSVLSPPLHAGATGCQCQMNAPEMPTIAPQGVMPSEGEVSLKPVPGSDIVAIKKISETDRVVSLPAPPSDGESGGPELIR